MSQDMLDHFNSMSDEALLDTYLDDAGKYRPEAVEIMEKLLEKRNISFVKKSFDDDLSPELGVRTPFVFSRKLYRKVLLWMMVFSVPGFFAELVYLEGKLFSDDGLMMFLYGWYKLFSFPSYLITKHSQEFVAVFLAYIFNISLVAILITWSIQQWKSVKARTSE